MSALHYSYIPKLQVKQMYRPKAAEMAFLSGTEGKPKNIIKTWITLKQFKDKRVGHNIIAESRVKWYGHIS